MCENCEVLRDELAEVKDRLEKTIETYDGRCRSLRVGIVRAIEKMKELGFDIQHNIHLAHIPVETILKIVIKLDEVWSRDHDAECEQKKEDK